MAWFGECTDGPMLGCRYFLNRTSLFLTPFWWLPQWWRNSCQRLQQPALARFYRCLCFAKSICTWHDQLWRFMFACFFFFRAFQAGERDLEVEMGGSRAPDTHDGRLSTTASRIPELAWKTRKSKSCFAGYELVNSSLVWHRVTQPRGG